MEKLKFFKVSEAAIWPSRGTEQSAGMDFFVPDPTKIDDELLVYMYKKVVSGNESMCDELNYLINQVNEGVITIKDYFWRLLLEYNKEVFDNWPTSADVNNYTGEVYLLIHPNEHIVIPSGITANIPHNKAIQLMNKSGIATKKSLVVGACLIDEDYTGIIHYDMHNIGEDPVIIKTGQKITQGVLINTNLDVEIECKEGSNDKGQTERGAGGFGSTGV